MNLKAHQSLYFQHAVQELVEDKIDLHFSRTRKVDDCGGYFDYINKELKVATWNKDWFSIFIHEYAHYKQWKNQTKLWCAVEDVDFFDGFNKRQVLATQLMEQECDKIVWSEVNKWGIEGQKNHIKMANSYHLSYVNMADRKKWLKKSPYRFKRILNLCPGDRFYTINELMNPEPKIYDLVDELCF
jgi:hypothetical protein